MCNQENERQDARGETTVNLQTPQRVSGFARHLTRGRSMGVRFPAVNIKPQTSGFADSGCDVEDLPPATSCLLSTVRVIWRSSEAVSRIKRSRYSHKSSLI